MKKIFNIGLVAAMLALTPAIVNAQTNETSVSYNKSSANAFVTSVAGEKEFVANSLEEYFKKSFNSKSTATKGFKLYKGVSWPEVSTDKLDVYYKVDHKKGNNQVTMLVSKGYDNFISSATDLPMAEGVKGFMNTIKDKALLAANASELAAAQKALEAAQKEYDRAAKKDEDLRKDKERIEKDIASQQKTIADREKDLNKAKAAVEAAKAK